MLINKPKKWEDMSKKEKVTGLIGVALGVLVIASVLIAALNGGDTPNTTANKAPAPISTTTKAPEPAAPTPAPIATPTPTQPAPTPTPSPAPTPTPAPDPTSTAPTDCTNGTYVNTAGNTVCSPETSSTVPVGATAQCVDGTYSFSQSHSGTCSHHGGVAQWLN